MIKSALSSEMVIQDLSLSGGQPVSEEVKFRVKVSRHQLIDNNLKLIGSQELDVSLGDENEPWMVGLRGIKFGAKRVIIFPLGYVRFL